MIEEEPKEDKKESRMFLDPYDDVKRLDVILKKLTIRFKKACNKGNDELAVKVANSLGLITSKKVDIVFTILGVEDLVTGKNKYRPK